MRPLSYGSVCSGIEAASVAWAPLGWRPAFYSEIKAFPRAVLARHWPEVPCHGDFTTIGADDYEPIDLLVGGTPCQSFSVAGFRQGLDDDRGNLALAYLRLAQRLQPRWLLWENVPNVLTTHKGRDFGAMLGALGELGYGFCWRVLDAQFFGVPQRRRRLFLVGHLGDWRRAAAVLVERESLQIRAEPGRQAGPGIAAGPEGDAGAADRPAAAFGANNTQGEIEVAAALNGHGGPHGRLDFHSETFIAFNARQDPEPGGLIDAQDDPLTAVAISFRGREDGVRLEIEPSDVAPCLRAAGGGSSHTFVQHFNAVRRLTPLECERLQGFPEGYTDIPFTSKRDRDGLRYEALGESMAVPVMRWLGERIAAVDALPCAA